MLFHDSTGVIEPAYREQCLYCQKSGSLPPVGNIWAMMIVWRIRGKIIRTALCCVVYDSCAQWYTRIHMSVVAWRSGNIVGRINKVTLYRTRLVLGWVTIFGGQTTSVFHQATQANSASYPQWDRKWVPAKSAVMLCSWGVKAGTVHSTCG